MNLKGFLFRLFFGTGFVAAYVASFLFGLLFGIGFMAVCCVLKLIIMLF